MFIVFDLDGTVIDGYDGITDALGYAMESLGRRPIPAERVRVLVGQGLERLIEKALGPELIAQGVKLFRERYAQVADEKTSLLPDVPKVLAALAAAGDTMAVASNKPSDFSRRILSGKGVAGYFTSIGGPAPDVPPKPDGEMLRRLMRDAGAVAEETVVVGDMEIDAQFARSVGCLVALVPGGSRSQTELAEVDADVHLSRLAELPGWLDTARRVRRNPRPTIAR